MHGSDLGSPHILRVLEGESQHPLAGSTRDEFDTLDDTVDDNVFNPGVLALGIFADEGEVDVIVRGFVTGNRFAGAHVGEQVEGTPESQVQGDVAFADRSGEGPFEGDVVAGDAWWWWGQTL